MSGWKLSCHPVASFTSKACFCLGVCVTGAFVLENCSRIQMQLYGRGAISHEKLITMAVDSYSRRCRRYTAVAHFLCLM